MLTDNRNSAESVESSLKAICQALAAAPNNIYCLCFRRRSLAMIKKLHGELLDGTVEFSLKSAESMLYGQLSWSFGGSGGNRPLAARAPFHLARGWRRRTSSRTTTRAVT